MVDQLSKLKPALFPLAVLIFGAIFGYIWGASSTSIVNTGIWQLQPDFQGIYVQAVADSYAASPNETPATQWLSFICQENDGMAKAFDAAAAVYGTSPRKSANLDQLRILTGQVTQSDGVCDTKAVGTLIGIGRLSWLILFFGAAGLLAYTYMQADKTTEATGKPATAPAAVSVSVLGEEKENKPAPAAIPSAAADTVKRVGGLFGRKKEAEEETEPRSAAAAGAVLSKEAEKTDYTSLGQDPPIVQFMTTYLHGDDLYDDSFSIETSSGEFLGETGVGISETIGSGSEAKNITALEVWLFDKNDIRTVTKVLMSDHAFSDDAIRAKLAPKGEAAQLKSGEKFVLHTATLRIQARVVDLAYQPSAMPPNSVIERVTLELAAWKSE